MGFPLDDELAEEHRVRVSAGLDREEPAPPVGADFVSNDYLGLARDPAVCAAARRALDEYGAGGRAARLLGGGAPPQRALEREVADWLGAPDALLFPSGYQATVGLVSALAGPGDVVLCDALSHASSIDGARMSRARVLVFEHDDPAHADEVLARARGARRKIVLTEGVFSMDGDRPRLAELSAVCARHGAQLVVDEAHAAGVVGPEGAGAWAAEPGEPDVLVARLVTGGKALGAGGALVVGSDALRTHLLHQARGFVFTTAVAPPLVGALRAAVERARTMDAERARIASNARRIARAVDAPRPGGSVVPVIVGRPEAAVAAAADLRAAGLEVRAVRPPTVAPGSSRLRVVVHAHNTDAEVERLVGALAATPRERTSAPLRTTARVVAVVGTDTGVGKTVVSAVLARAAARRGEAAYWKPVQTGAESDTREVERLADGVGLHLHAPTFEFALPASPDQAAAAEGAVVDVQALDVALARHRARPGTLILEPAGGLLVPLDDEHDTADWLARARPTIVLVARAGLGTLNHTRLTLEALRARRLEPRALFLVGEPHVANRATLARAARAPVYELGPLAPLDPRALDAWLQQNDVSEVFA